MNGINDNQEKNILVLGLVLLLALWGVLHFLNSKAGSKVAISPASQTGLAIQVTRADQGVTTLPQGFPSDIPVGQVITQSYSAYYPNNQTTQYTVSYVTSGIAKEVVGTYLTYLKKNSYSAIFSTDNYAVGTQGRHSLSVSVGPTAGRNGLLVTVNLLVH